MAELAEQIEHVRRESNFAWRRELADAMRAVCNAAERGELTEAIKAGEVTGQWSAARFATA